MFIQKAIYCGQQVTQLSHNYGCDVHVLSLLLFTCTPLLEPSLEQTLAQRVPLLINSLSKELVGVGKPLWFVGEESSHNAARAARRGARLHAVLAGASDFVQTPQLQDFTAGCRPVSSCGPRVASVAGA